VGVLCVNVFAVYLRYFNWTGLDDAVFTQNSIAHWACV
jgi:hypothetical protein